MSGNARTTELPQITVRVPLNGDLNLTYNQNIIQRSKDGEMNDSKVSVVVNEVEPAKPPQVIATYKSFTQVFIMVCVICYNSLMFGYLFSTPSTITPQKFKDFYNITFSIGYAQGIANGVLPIGGLLGSLTYPYYQKLMTRKFALFPASAMAIIGAALTMVPYLPTLIIGRFLIGLCSGYAIGLTPFLIKDLSPKELRGIFGAFNNLARIIGIVICFAVGLLMHFVFPSYGYQVTVGILIILVIIQIFLVYFLVPESPGQMAMKKNFDELQKSIRWIYKQQFVQKMIQQYKDQYLFQVSNTQIVEMKPAKYVDYSKNRTRAFSVAMNIAIIRQFIGINTLVLYAGDFMAAIDPPLAIYTPIIINVLQLISGILATKFLVNSVGRRILLVSGVGIMCIINLCCGIGALFQNQIVLLVFMIVAMIGFAATFNPPSWSYQIQIIPPTQIVYTTIANWIFMLVVTLVPPIISQVMPNHNSYPIFFFFSACCFVSFIHMFIYAIEIKGMTYEQILVKF